MAASDRRMLRSTQMPLSRLVFEGSAAGTDRGGRQRDGELGSGGRVTVRIVLSSEARCAAALAEHGSTGEASGVSAAVAAAAAAAAADAAVAGAATSGADAVATSADEVAGLETPPATDVGLLPGRAAIPPLTDKSFSSGATDGEATRAGKSAIASSRVTPQPVEAEEPEASCRAARFALAPA